MDDKLRKRVGKIRYHRRWILAGTTLCMLAALILSRLQPKIYRATTYILVSDSKIGSTPQNVAWQYYTMLLPTFIPFVDNEALMARAIRDLHLDQTPYLLTAERFRRRGYLDVRIPKSTRLLEINVEFPDSRLAAELANYFAQKAAEFNDELTAADTLTTQKFLNHQLDQAAARLSEMEAKRLEVRKRARIEDKEKELSILLDHKAQVSNQLETLRLALPFNESSAKSLEQALAAEPRTFLLKKSVTSDRFLERATEKLGADTGSALSATEEVLNTTHEEERRKLLDLTSGAAGDREGIQAATKRLSEINRQINDLLTEMATLRSQMEKGEQDFKLAREAYESASRDYRNASLTVTAKSQDLQQVAPALVPEKPVRPMILLNTILAGLLGLVLLSGAALAIESFREMRPEMVRFVTEEEAVKLRRS